MCETAIRFLHIQLTGTNVLLPKIHSTPPEVDFESSRSPAKSESWNSPNPALFCIVSYMTILFVFTGVMDVRYQTRSIVCHMFESILWLMSQVYLLTTRYKSFFFVRSTDRQTDRSAWRADDPPRTIQITTQQEPYGQNNSPPTLSTTGFSVHHIANMFSLLPTFQASEQRSPSEPLHTERSSCAPPTYSSKHKVRREFPENPSFSWPQSCQRFHCLTCLPLIVRHLEAGEPFGPPVESNHTFPRLVQTPYLHPYTWEGYALVFSSLDPADCATGRSLEFQRMSQEHATWILASLLAPPRISGSTLLLISPSNCFHSLATLSSSLPPICYI